MLNFYLKLAVYFVAYFLALLALRAIDFARLVKKNRVFETWLLYLILGMALAYLLGNFFIEIIYYFQA